MSDSLKIENGKYEIVIEEDYSVNIYRGGEVWISKPLGEKMFIALVHEPQSNEAMSKQKDRIIKDLQERLNGFLKEEESNKYTTEE